MRGDSLRNLYAKTMALLGLGLLAGAGALVDYWPTGIELPVAGPALVQPEIARALPVPDFDAAPAFARPRPATLRVAAAKPADAALPVLLLSETRDLSLGDAIAPGIILTPLHGDADEGTKGFLKTLSPSGRVGDTQDIVDAVLYMTDSQFTSGTVLPIDGGAAAGSW